MHFTWFLSHKGENVVFRFSGGGFSVFQLAGCLTLEVQCGVDTNLTMRLFVLLLPCGFLMMLLVWVLSRSH